MNENTLRTELPEKFRYLFDDMEREMGSICETDSVIVRLLSDIDRYSKRSDEALSREKVASEDLTKLETKISEAEAQLASLDRERRVAAGTIRGEKYTRKFMRRLIALREQKICAREKKLLMWEAQKRLATIGRTLKQNTGRRGGGGFDIVRAE